MPHLYVIATGEWRGPTGELFGIGYAGALADGCQNNPERVAWKDRGPLPPGRYEIGLPHTEPHLGTVALRLTPDAGNVMYGRGGFFVHGPNPAHPQDSSEGCIVLSAAARVKVGMALSTDRMLDVVATSAQQPLFGKSVIEEKIEETLS